MVKPKVEVSEVNNQESKKSGFFGVFENLLRKFKQLSFILGLAPLVVLYLICLSTAFLPLAMIGRWVAQILPDLSFIAGSIVVALGLGLSALGFILFLPLAVVIVNKPLIKLVKRYRGPWFSLESIPWFYHNALFYLVRYTILDLFTPSPLSHAFLRGMGMKIGEGTMVNTSNISDPCLIKIGDHVTVGGSTYMMAHYGMKGYLIIDSMTIHSKANIGLHAYLMGSVVVGEGAQVYPNTMVLPKTQIAANTKYGASEWQAKESTSEVN